MQLGISEYITLILWTVLFVQFTRAGIGIYTGAIEDIPHSLGWPLVIVSVITFSASECGTQPYLF
jgi:hypothetical protein